MSMRGLSDCRQLGPQHNCEFFEYMGDSPASFPFTFSRVGSEVHFHSGAGRGCGCFLLLVLGPGKNGTEGLWLFLCSQMMFMG